MLGISPISYFENQTLKHLYFKFHRNKKQE